MTTSYCVYIERFAGEFDAVGPFDRLAEAIGEAESVGRDDIDHGRPASDDAVTHVTVRDAAGAVVWDSREAV